CSAHARALPPFPTRRSSDLPSDPWIAWDVVGRLRERFVLQNLIHWIKAISIAREDAGSQSGLPGDLSVGHYKPINSDRYLNDARSEEHTSELQSRFDLVCRL